MHDPLGTPFGLWKQSQQFTRWDNSGVLRRIQPDGRSQPVGDAREMPAEPEKPTSIPHLEGKGEESFLEESRGNRVYTRRRVLEAFSLLLYVAKFRAE